jgi:hypothetical protein
LKYQAVPAENSTLCVALSHDGGFAALFPPTVNCDDTSFRAAFPDLEGSLKSDLSPDPNPLKIPLMLSIPGVLSMVDAGGGQLFFAADAIDDLVALDLTETPLQPTYFHTGLEATNLYAQDKVLWIAGSKGMTTLDFAKKDASAWESDLAKPPLRQGAYGQWSKVAKSTSLLVEDVATGDELLPSVSPASFAIDGGEKNPKKPTASKIAISNPYGQSNKLTFELKSWCDPSRKSKVPCTPATKGLEEWSITSPAGPNSCNLTDPKTDPKTAEITQTGTVGAACVLQVDARADKAAFLAFAVRKPKLSDDKATIEISFCVVGEDNPGCP